MYQNLKQLKQEQEELQSSAIPPLPPRTDMPNEDVSGSSVPKDFSEVNVSVDDGRSNVSYSTVKKDNDKQIQQNLEDIVKKEVAQSAGCMANGRFFKLLAISECILLILVIGGLAFTLSVQKEAKQAMAMSRSTAIAALHLTEQDSWSSWSTWSPCSLENDGCVKKRTRTCEDPNFECIGLPENRTQCQDRDCSYFDEWSPWSQCPTSCGVGVVSRYRSCYRFDGSQCSEVRLCNEKNPCQEIDDWSTWTTCPTTCGVGIQSRNRSCSRVDGSPCSEVKLCNENKPCTEQGQWADWPSWTPCTMGFNFRSRKCVSSPCNGERFALMCNRGD